MGANCGQTSVVHVKPWLRAAGDGTECLHGDSTPTVLSRVSNETGSLILLVPLESCPRTPSALLAAPAMRAYDALRLAADTCPEPALRAVMGITVSILQIVRVRRSPAAAPAIYPRTTYPRARSARASTAARSRVRRQSSRRPCTASCRRALPNPDPAPRTRSTCTGWPTTA